MSEYLVDIFLNSHVPPTPYSRKKRGKLAPRLAFYHSLLTAIDCNCFRRLTLIMHPHQHRNFSSAWNFGIANAIVLCLN